MQLSDNNPKGNQTTEEEIHCSSAEGEKPPTLRFTQQCQRHIAICPPLSCVTSTSELETSASHQQCLESCLERGKTPAEPHDARRCSVVLPALVSSWADETGGVSSMPGRGAGSAGSPPPGECPCGVAARRDHQETGAPSAPGGTGSRLVCKASFKMDFKVN